jgi:anti-anti-sigma regulatory factor
MAARDDEPPGPRPAALIVCTLRPPIARIEIPGMCADLAGVLRGRTGVLVWCDADTCTQVDAVILEALLCLHLTVRRTGNRLRLRGASAELRDLLAFTGLAQVLAGEASVEPGR